MEEKADTLENYQQLIAAVLRTAIAYSPSYIASPWGRFWIEMLGLDPKVVWEKWFRVRGEASPEYAKSSCSICRGRRCSVEERNFI